MSLQLEQGNVAAGEDTVSLLFEEGAQPFVGGLDAPLPQARPAHDGGLEMPRENVVDRRCGSHASSSRVPLTVLDVHLTRTRLLQAQQSEGNHRDAIRAPVRSGTGSEHHQILDLIAELFLEPMEMFDVVIADRRSELHLERDDSSAASLEDEIDFVLAALGAQMTEAALQRLGDDPDGEGRQRFEERAEERSVPPDDSALTVEQILGLHIERTSGEGWIGKVVLGSGGKTTKRRTRRPPSR